MSTKSTGLESLAILAGIAGIAWVAYSYLASKNTVTTCTGVTVGGVCVGGTSTTAAPTSLYSGTPANPAQIVSTTKPPATSSNGTTNAGSTWITDLWDMVSNTPATPIGAVIALPGELSSVWNLISQGAVQLGSVI